MLMYVCMYVCICVYVYVCMYVCMYVFVYIYIYICMSVFIQSLQEESKKRVYSIITKE